MVEIRQAEDDLRTTCFLTLLGIRAASSAADMPNIYAPGPGAQANGLDERTGDFALIKNHN